MAEKLGVYRCENCGNIVEVMHASKISIKCCGSSMVLQVENTVDAAKEKHVPVVENTEKGIRIRVGEVEHPMTDDHYIQWIEVISGDSVYQKYLHPGGTPEAEFQIDGDPVTVRAYCNLHGHWKAS